MSIPALSLRTWAATVLEGIDSSVSCPWPGIGEGRMKVLFQDPSAAASVPVKGVCAERFLAWKWQL